MTNRKAALGWEERRIMHDQHLDAMLAWTPTLQAGDIVGITHTAIPWERNFACRACVVRHTPTGMLRVRQDDGTTRYFKPNGVERYANFILDRIENLTELIEQCEVLAQQETARHARSEAWRETIGLDSEAYRSFDKLTTLLNNADGPQDAMRPHVERILSLLVAAGLVERGSVTVSESGRPPQAERPTMAPWLETGKDAWSRIQVNCPSTDIGGYATVDNCGWILEADDIMVRGTETGAAAREIIDSHLLIAGWCLQKGQT